MEDAQSPRIEYRRGTLRRDQLDPDPVLQFESWFTYARTNRKADTSAMALATADAQGHPSSRMVLLKSFDGTGFVFATNYASRKGRELLENPHAALLFFWEDLQQQIRIEGKIQRTTDAESDDIFSDRPLGSRVAAISSSQSEPIDNRSELEAIFEANTARYAVDPPKRPDWWGGYRLIPERFEFWQGGVNRLHDRFEYQRADDAWIIRRLQP